MWAHGPRWQHCFKRSAAGRAKSPSAARHGGNIKFQRGGSVSGADGDDQLSTQVWRNTSVNRKQWQRARELQDTRVWLSLHTELWKNYSWWSDPCLHIFIYVYIYLYVYMFIYVYIYLHMFICVYICLYLCFLAGGSGQFNMGREVKLWESLRVNMNSYELKQCQVVTSVD